MQLTLVAALFFCIWIHGFARNGTNNEVDIYEKNSTDAVKFPVDRFLKLLQERHIDVSKTFDNETSNRIIKNKSEGAITSFVDNSTANETTSNASENEMVSFVDNSTQIEKIAYGTKEVNELEHVVDGLMKETMGKVSRIKEEGFADNSTQILPLFLAENEKNVKVENKVLEFLNDATVNITVENNQLTLFVKDDSINTGEKILYFCFKSTIQSYVSSNCPFGFCEVQIKFLSDGQSHAAFMDFDGHSQTFRNDVIIALISENSMKVTNVPNAPPPITTCNPDFSQGYWTVKIINKRNTTVHLQDVELFKPEQHEMEIDMTLATIAGIAVGGFAILVFLIGAGALIVSVNAEKSSQNKIMKNDSQPKPDSQNKAQIVQPRKEQKIDVAQK